MDEGPVSEEERRPGWIYKPALMVLTGVDRPDAREDLELLDELMTETAGRPWPWTAVSSVTDPVAPGQVHTYMPTRSVPMV